MIKISPSILSADFANLERDIKKAAYHGVEYIHVDVMDGNFVPNITIGAPVVKALRRVTELTLDVHLMIDRPIRYIADFQKAGSDIITVHLEADTEENIMESLRLIRSSGCRPGLSIKPGTPADSVFPLLPLCDLVLVMTVEPGFGGQSFMADMLPKIRAIRDAIDADFPGTELEVDGGINAETAQLVKKAGANVLVAGSAFFGSPDISKFVEALRRPV
ncbi:MAG: ribulose-phosphate 3-epimerase [Oscillospiraceae bacterium]|jgi:ribulose-phosphate 3-epimerase